MSKITKKQVQHIAKLADLTLSEKEVEKFRKELSDTLGYIEVLDELDTENVKPTAQVTGLKNVFRDDEVDKERYLSQKEALSQAESKEDGFFKAKRVI